jgi:preprotein translocase subunit SecE
MNPIANFLQETKMELKKVAWPTREQTIQYTLVVLGVSAVMVAYLGSLDYIFTFILNTFVFNR